MTSPTFVFYLMCLFMWKNVTAAQTTAGSLSVRQSGFVSATVGDSITLPCFYEGDMVARFYWLKQTLSQKLRLISSYYRFGKSILYDEFKNNSRFTLETKNGQIDLKISDLDFSDSATYYCAGSFSKEFTFFATSIVSVKGSGLNIPVLVHQSASETIQPGGSVTLNCTVQTGTCGGEHSVNWFRKSEKSHLGLIYAHGGRNDSCERKPSTQTQTCVYNLPTKNQSLSHAGTYYCAVASCGHILFGKWSKLDFEDSLVLVYFLSGALAFITILNLFLAFFLYILRKRTRCQCRESHVRFPAASTINAEVYTNEDNLHYAALGLEKARRSRRQRHNTEDECLYSTVKQ